MVSVQYFGIDNHNPPLSTIEGFHWISLRRRHLGKHWKGIRWFRCVWKWKWPNTQLDNFVFYIKSTVSHRYYVFQRCNPGSMSRLNNSFLYINGWYQPHRLGLCSQWVLMLHLTQHSSSPTENIHKYINVHCCVLLGCWGKCLGNDNTDPSRSSGFPNPSYHLLSLLKQYMFIYPSICLRGL